MPLHLLQVLSQDRHLSPARKTPSLEQSEHLLADSTRYSPALHSVHLLAESTHPAQTGEQSRHRSPLTKTPRLSHEDTQVPFCVNSSPEPHFEHLPAPEHCRQPALHGWQVWGRDRLAGLARKEPSKQLVQLSAERRQVLQSGAQTAQTRADWAL